MNPPSRPERGAAVPIEEQPSTRHFDRPLERIRVIELLLGVIGVGIEFTENRSDE